MQGTENKTRRQLRRTFNYTHIYENITSFEKYIVPKTFCSFQCYF